MGMKKSTLFLPTTLSFKKTDIIDFDSYLSLFKWDINADIMTIDGRKCKNANYQAITLLVMYIWHLKQQGMQIDLKMPKTSFNGLGSMWRRVGGMGCFNVLENSDENFRFAYDKPLFAIRRKASDMKNALDTILEYFNQMDLEVLKGQEQTIHYLISELLYNAIEHGINPNIPALLQINWYKKKGQLSFIIADMGIGIKRHLEQTYPTFTSDAAAIEYALGPEISGTFKAPKASYAAQNNAGMGLYLSSGIGKKLEAIYIRDKKLLPALREGRSIILDFTDVESATHSFLTALLVTSIKEFGLLAYKRIRIIGCDSKIREMIDFVFESYT